MITFLCVLSSALAGQVGLTGGMEFTGNDPFVVRAGPRLGLEFAPRPQLRFGLSGAYYPDFGEGNWTPLTSQMVNENHIAPDISLMTAQARGELRVVPFIHRIGILEAHTGAYGGLGVVHTEDDLEALQQEDDPWALATASQNHPTATWGVFSEVGGDTVRGRLRFERTTYVETVSSLTLEMKSTLLWALEVTVWLGE